MLRNALHLLLGASVASAHIIITYPGSRGNNFITNETFPFGMQWDYPCGGLTLSHNRTFWATTGGALAFQPGWFSGHSRAFLYVNIGLDRDGPDGGPKDWSTQLVPRWQLLGPSNGPYPGTLCLPDISIPESLGVKAGDNASIQVVEIATHGASLYACSDITFVEPGDARIPAVNSSNCFNTQELGFADIHTITIQAPLLPGLEDEESGASETLSFWYMRRNEKDSPWRPAVWLPIALGGLWAFI